MSIDVLEPEHTKTNLAIDEVTKIIADMFSKMVCSGKKLGIILDTRAVVLYPFSPTEQIPPGPATIFVAQDPAIIDLLVTEIVRLKKSDTYCEICKY